MTLSAVVDVLPFCEVIRYVDTALGIEHEVLKWHSYLLMRDIEALSDRLTYCDICCHRRDNLSILIGASDLPLAQSFQLCVWQHPPLSLNLFPILAPEWHEHCVGLPIIKDFIRILVPKTISHLSFLQEECLAKVVGLQSLRHLPSRLENGLWVLHYLVPTHHQVFGSKQVLLCPHLGQSKCIHDDALELEVAHIVDALPHVAPFELEVRGLVDAGFLDPLQHDVECLPSVIECRDVELDDQVSKLLGHPLDQLTPVVQKIVVDVPESAWETHDAIGESDI